MAISAHANTMTMGGTNKVALTSPTNEAPVFTMAMASLILLYMHSTNTIVSSRAAQKK